MSGIFAPKALIMLNYGADILHFIGFVLHMAHSCSRFFSQTETDLESHRCIVSKQKVLLFFCVKVYWCYATHALHSSNNYFPTILFDYKWALLIVFHPSCLVYFKEEDLHFAPFSLSSLVANSLFSRPITHFLAPKNHFLTTILPFWAMFLMAWKGFVYAIAVHFYAFRFTFRGIWYCILRHFTLRFAPFCLAFSIKTHCV